MRFAFSTVGCPDWSWSEVVATAKDLEYDGVEVRGIGGHVDLPRAREFTGGALESTLATLRRTGIAIPCLASSCYLHEDGTGDAKQADGRAYVDLAAAMGAPFVRVLGDTNPEPAAEADVVPMVGRALTSLGRYAADRGVTVLIETNGIFADSRLMAEVMAENYGSGVGVLWDIHHPYRYFGESIEVTWGRLKHYIRHIHVKDSRRDRSSVKYTLVGDGDVPVREALTLLSAQGYDGWVSLEWVKRWRPDLEEPGLVFPHFIDFARRAIDKA